MNDRVNNNKWETTTIPVYSMASNIVNGRRNSHNVNLTNVKNLLINKKALFDTFALFLNDNIHICILQFKLV